jgi:hypothetical protein
VREAFAPDLPLEQAITRVMFAVMRDVNHDRLNAADIELAHAGPSLADKGIALAGFFSTRELVKLTVDGVYLGNHVPGWRATEDRQVAELPQVDSDLTVADAAPRMIVEGGQRVAGDSAFRSPGTTVLGPTRENIPDFGEGAEATVGPPRMALAVPARPRPEGGVLRLVDDGTHTPTLEWSVEGLPVATDPRPAVAASAEGLAPPLHVAPPAGPLPVPLPGPPTYREQLAAAFGGVLPAWFPKG